MGVERRGVTGVTAGERPGQNPTEAQKAGSLELLRLPTGVNNPLTVGLYKDVQKGPTTRKRVAGSW